MLVPVAGQARLQLEANTAAKYKLLRERVYARAQKWLFITEPYGANRTYAEQKWLRTQWEKGVPGFFYAADPDTPQANHLKGCAFDLNNWASVGQAVITEEAERLGLVRDNSEPWHWNNPEGIALVLAGVDYEELEDDLPLSDEDIKKIANATAVAVLTGSFGDKDGVSRELRTVLNNIDRAATDTKSGVAGVDKRLQDVQSAVLNGHGGPKIAEAVWDHPITRGDVGPDKKPVVSRARDLVGTSQLWVNQIIATITKGR